MSEETKDRARKPLSLLQYDAKFWEFFEALQEAPDTAEGVVALMKQFDILPTSAKFKQMIAEMGEGVDPKFIAAGKEMLAEIERLEREENKNNT